MKINCRPLLILLLASFPWISLADSPGGVSADCVVLLHGLGRSAAAMAYAERQLQQQGYLTVNTSYPSTSKDIDLLAQQHVGDAVEQCKSHNPPHIHFVTHSMGGILARQYLQDNSLPLGSRLVMLSPPNHGSELVDKWRDNPLFRFFAGPAALQLATDSPKWQQLKPLNLEIGVIAGNAGNGGWFGLSGPNDNVVTVDSARLAEMRDFLVLPANHIGIRRSDAALQQVIGFLAHGRFTHQAEAVPIAERGNQLAIRLEPVASDLN